MEDNFISILIDKIMKVDPANLLVFSVLLALVIYAYRAPIFSIIETYTVGRRRMRGEEVRTEEESTESLKEMLTMLRGDIIQMQESQTQLLRNQEMMREEIQALKDEVNHNNETLNAKIEYVSDQCDFLKVCDKEDKKAYITREYNYFYIRLKKIDLYSKATLEKIYDLYLKENGDTFVAGMMSQIRSLPTVSQITEIDKQGPTQTEIESVDSLTGVHTQ